jgi:hypothetical protein
MLEVTSYRHRQEAVKQILNEELSFEVNPLSLTKTIKKEFEVNNDLLQNQVFFEYFVVGGKWDLDYGHFREERNFLEMKDLVDFGSRFRESGSFKRSIKELEDNRPQKDHGGLFFKSIKDVEKSFEYYLELISKMRSKGYVSQNQLTGGKPDSEIGVAISRNSELFHFRTGHHRLAIAQLIKLPSVKVTVHLVHENWVHNRLKLSNRSDILSSLQNIQEKVVEIDESATSG